MEKTDTNPFLYEVYVPAHLRKGIVVVMMPERNEAACCFRELVRVFSRLGTAWFPWEL